MTNGDKGGRGSKNLIFAVASFLNGPLGVNFSVLIQLMIRIGVNDSFLYSISLLLSQTF